LVKRVEVNQDDINVVFRIDATLPTPDPARSDQNSFLPDRGRGVSSIMGSSGWLLPLPPAEEEGSSHPCSVAGSIFSSRRSTRLPPITWRRRISSTSAWVSYLYQTPSG